LPRPSPERRRADAVLARTENRRVLAFFALACALSWAYWIPLAVLADPVERGAGWPTHLPGLLGPALAAFLLAGATEGRAAVRALVRSMASPPRRPAAIALAFSPLLFLLFALALVGAAGDLPAAGDFVRFSGTGAGLLALIGALTLTGFGEETGWRGYALPRLLPRRSPVRASLLVGAGWAVWHIPLFAVLTSFGDFGLAMLLGWLVGLAAGSLVLADVWLRTGGSIFAAAAWHATYNLGAGTAAGEGMVAPVLTAFVIAWAVAVLRRG
jgi:membrane protease YdiL (CAAX protease family)